MSQEGKMHGRGVMRWPREKQTETEGQMDEGGRMIDHWTATALGSLLVIPPCPPPSTRDRRIQT